jgi:hypothetical protein
MPPEYEIRPVLATPPDGKPLNNPENLTAEQVGLGYRLTRKGEKPTPGAQVWKGLVHSSGEWQKRDDDAAPYYAGSTYRLPLSVPWPLLPIATLAQDQIELTAEQHAAVETCLKEEAPPFQLPPPPPGKQWHREDGWKSGDLPQGHRPLAEGEELNPGDEGDYGDGFMRFSGGNRVLFPQYFYRTTRPLVFTREGKQWTYHKPGDPMPCDGEAFVDCFCKGGETLLATRAKVWSWRGDIIGWRYAETTKQVPLGPKDVIAKLKEAIAMLESLTNKKA